MHNFLLTTSLVSVPEAIILGIIQGVTEFFSD